MALDGSTVPGGDDAGQMYQRRKGSLWDAQLHPCKDSFALDFREHITPTCREGKGSCFTEKQPSCMLKRPSLGRGSGKLRDASQGPVQLPHPLDDLLEVGSRAASIFMTVKPSQWLSHHLPTFPCQVLMPMYASQ